MKRLIHNLFIQSATILAAFFLLAYAISPARSQVGCISVDRLISIAEQSGALVQVIEGDALTRAKMIYASVPPETEISTAERGLIVVPKQGAGLLVLLDREGGAASCSTLSIPQKMLANFMNHVMGNPS